MAKTALLAKLTAKDGQRDALLAVIADLGMKNVSGEPGTEVYAAHKDQNDSNIIEEAQNESRSDQDGLMSHRSGTSSMRVRPLSY